MMTSVIALVYAHGGFASSLCHVSGTAVVAVNEEKGKGVETVWKNTRKSTTTPPKKAQIATQAHVTEEKGAVKDHESTQKE